MPPAAASVAPTVDTSLSTLPTVPVEPIEHWQKAVAALTLGNAFVACAFITKKPWLSALFGLRKTVNEPVVAR